MDEATEVRFYAVKTFPERFALWQMGGLTGDLLQGALQYPCPFLLTLGVEILDPETTRAAVYANQTRATQNAESPMAKLLPDIPKKKRDWDAAADALDAGTKLVSLYHELALFTPRTGRPRPKRAPKRSGARAGSSSTTTSTCTGSRCRRACPCNCRSPFTAT